MRWLVVSVAVHALVLWLVVRGEEGTQVVRGDEHVTRSVATSTDEPTEIIVLENSGISSGGGGGGGATASATSIAHSRASTRPRTRSTNPWDGLSVRNETSDDMRRNGNGNGNGNGSGNGNGNGIGNGNGNGNGIGFGNGGGVRVERDVPAPPVPKVSKARPAKLIWPNRDLDVEDETYLFVAKVTVDEEGSVVGARMTTSRPGSRGEHAANAIWTFRYAPALDDDGKPIKSTFEQPFQVR